MCQCVRFGTYQSIFFNSQVLKDNISCKKSEEESESASLIVRLQKKKIMFHMYPFIWQKWGNTLNSFWYKYSGVSAWFCYSTSIDKPAQDPPGCEILQVIFHKQLSQYLISGEKPPSHVCQKHVYRYEETLGSKNIARQAAAQCPHVTLLPCSHITDMQCPGALTETGLNMYTKAN